MLSGLRFGKGHSCRLSSKGWEGKRTSERQGLMWIVLDGDGSWNQDLAECGCQASVAVED